MRKWIALTIPLSSSLLCACGPALAAQPEPKTTTGETPQAIVFFQNVPKPNVPLTLQPDPRVEQALPQIVPPKQPVVVYLPVYPGAAKAAPDKRIGDMGTPLDGDLVDGTLYFQVKATPDQIEAWYAKQLRTLGYRESGHGQSTANGAVVSGTVSFTKDGVPPGQPVSAPDIDVGFLLSAESGKTTFAVKALYIVTPERPKDTYLPNDIVSVTLTDGQTSKTITDKHWIPQVVQAFNALHMSTPGVSSGLAVSGPARTITATFRTSQGTALSARFSIASETVQVGDVTLNCTSTLTQSIQSALDG